MKILVIGAGGFVGKHLISALHNKKHQVIATVKHVAANHKQNEQIIAMDITNPESVYETLVKIKPEAIINLAAQSMVGLSWENPALTLEVNTIGTINLIKAVKQAVPQALLVTIGSSEEYGLTGKLGLPLTEDQPCRPQNPYAISKFAAGQIAMQLAKKHDLKIVHLRPFNHFGPGQQEGYVVSDFASQVARIEHGLCPPVIKVGDLNARRDFTDVRDVVEAYTLLLDHYSEPGIYNVCSGVARSPQAILDILLNNTAIAIKVEQDRERFRPAEVPLFVGSAAKLYQLTGWQPKRNFQDSVIETLDWWRAKIVSEHSLN